MTVNDAPVLPAPPAKGQPLPLPAGMAPATAPKN